MRVMILHTIPVAIYHAIIVSGSAIIYLIRFVKLNSRARFPSTPTAKEIAFSIVSHPGSPMSMPPLSAPSGSCPLFGSSTLHFEARAAMERTLARGPMVAARSGMAVDANHHLLYSEIC
jgi:hypothetical protein